MIPEQERARSPGAEWRRAMARPEESAPVLLALEYENFTCRRTARIDFVCNVTFAVAVLGIALAFLRPVSTRHPPAPAITRAAPLAEVALAGPTEPRDAPVRMKIAFDATEEFEFPHGVPESAAREAPAELLSGRARDLRAVGLTFSRGGTLQPDRHTAFKQGFVIRPLARAKETFNGTN
jgi:hypothetical protein